MSRYKSKRSQATDFDKDTKIDMLRRDGYRCIFCSNSESLTPAHYISRAKGGLGILENGVCLCVQCHQALDQSPARAHLQLKLQRYLKIKHPDFKDEDRIYDRRQWLNASD